MDTGGNIEIQETTMDDQTRLARYESMRKGRGGANHTHRLSENKKLFLVHMDLRKQCERRVRGYAKDAKMATRDMGRQQKLMGEKRDALKKQMDTFRKDTEKNKAMLETAKSAHETRQQCLNQEASCGIEGNELLKEGQLVRALGFKLAKPKVKKSRP